METRQLVDLRLVEDIVGRFVDAGEEGEAGNDCCKSAKRRDQATEQFLMQASGLPAKPDLHAPEAKREAAQAGCRGRDDAKTRGASE